MKHEPVTVTAAITAAITSTLALLAFAGVPAEVIGALGVASTAWVTLGGVIVRSKVTPTVDVALTNDEVAALRANQSVD